MKWIKIKELNVEVTEILHKGKTFDECISLKPKDVRLLTYNEVIGLMNSDKLELLLPKVGWSDFFFEQPIKLYKENGKRAIAFRRGGWLGLALSMGKTAKADWRGVVWARKLGK
jgi:hypothetical protein